MTYADLKELAHEMAETSVAFTECEAKAAGYKDVFDLLMSDREHPRQTRFLIAITTALSIPERKMLLNGLAREYAASAGWLDYCADFRGPSDNRWAIGESDQGAFG